MTINKVIQNIFTANYFSTRNTVKKHSKALSLLSLLLLILPFSFGMAQTSSYSQIHIRELYQMEDGSSLRKEKTLDGQFSELEIEALLHNDSNESGQLVSRTIEWVLTDTNGNTERRKYYKSLREKLEQDNKHEMPLKNFHFELEQYDSDEIPDDFLWDDSMDIEEEWQQGGMPDLSDLLRDWFGDGGMFENFDFRFEFPQGDSSGMPFMFDFRPFEGGGKRSGSFLGVQTSPGYGSGAEITDVVPESPAAKADIRPGDIITSIDDVPVSGGKELTMILRKRSPEQEIKVNIIRDGQEMVKFVKLEEKQGGSAKDFSLQDLFSFGDRQGQWPWSKEKEKKNKSILGVGVQELTNFDGLKVVRVDEGSPAHKAGIQVDDVILKLDKIKIKSPEQLKSLLDDKSGEMITLQLARSGKKFKTKVQLLSKHEQ